MSRLTISSAALAVLMLAACSASKKSTNATTTAPAAAAATTKPANGVFAPGNEELAAIRVQYPLATMAVLNEGHALYTGVCTKCHGAKNIYSRSAAQWPAIIDDMALKAHITDKQKNAVFQYVLAIKATQPGAKAE